MAVFDLRNCNEGELRELIEQMVDDMEPEVHRNMTCVSILFYLHWIHSRYMDGKLQGNELAFNEYQRLMMGMLKIGDVALEDEDGNVENL